MVIYKKDSKGKIRSLEVTTEEGDLLQISGLLDGKKVTHRKSCGAKNIGKSNETTPEIQAKIQAAAVITKKVREGYFTSIEEATSTNVIMPMLAKDYFKELKKLKKVKKIAVQPKLDGIRSATHYTLSSNASKAMTRNNKAIDNIQPILDDINKALKDCDEDIILDGELYVHGKTFQEVSKLQKNVWMSQGEPLEYWIYDIIDSTRNFEERSLYISDLFSHLDSEYITIVPTFIIDNTEAEIKRMYEYFIELGYEGMMIRVLDSDYKIKGRSSDLLKYKEFIDVTLPIADVTPNVANPKHGTVWVVFNGHLQKTGAKLSHTDREEILTNKNDYIGQMGEFRYFEETDDGKMRFPVYHGLRTDK